MYIKQKGFTLIELLVVVAILGLISGLVIVGYDGLISRSARGTSANTLATLTQAIRSYEVLERRLPDNLETLVHVSVAGGSTSFNTSRLDNEATAYGLTTQPGLTALLHPELAARLEIVQLTETQKNNLRMAGIDRLRYLDRRGEGEGGPLDLRAGDQSSATVGPLELIEVPQFAFDTPEPGAGRNRGRGFALRLSQTNDSFRPHLARWSPGVGGYENVRLGGQPDSTLVLLGIGRNSSLVAAQPGQTARLETTPFLSDVGRHAYGHFLMVLDVDQRPARLVTLIDPRGETLAENAAGAQGM